MVFDVREYGAIADGTTLNTAAIQKAIDACYANGGGRVLIVGGRYKTGTLFYKSNVEIHIAADGVLLGSENRDDYPNCKDLTHVNTERLPRFSSAALLFSENCENIALTGYGKIDCNGDAFVEETTLGGWKYKRKYDNSPPRVVFFTGCQHIRIEGVTMINQPAGWSYWVHDCDYVHIDKINILADVDYPNNDGIHINCSRNVTVSNCNIVCGDDCIVVRANSSSLKENKSCEKVCVTNCNLTSYSGGIRIGWTNDGVIKNCVFSNLVMTDTSVGISLMLPAPFGSDVGREETLIENLSFDNIVMDKICSNSVKINISDDERVTVKGVRNLSFNNIRAGGIEFPELKGRKNCRLSNIRFSNCDFTITDGSEFDNRFQHGWTTHNDGEYHPFFVRYVDGLKLHNVEFKE